MNPYHLPKIFYLVSPSHISSLLPFGLGIVNGLNIKNNLNVNFIKPISHVDKNNANFNLSNHFAKIICNTLDVSSIPLSYAMNMINSGKIDNLMEDIAFLIESVSFKKDCDIVIIEGIIPNSNFQIAYQINFEIIRSFKANIILVISEKSIKNNNLGLIESTIINQYTNNNKYPITGALINNCSNISISNINININSYLSNKYISIPIIANIPEQYFLKNLSIIDIVNFIGLSILNLVKPNSSYIKKFLVLIYSSKILFQTLETEYILIIPVYNIKSIYSIIRYIKNRILISSIILVYKNKFPIELLKLKEFKEISIFYTKKDIYHIISCISKMSSSLTINDIEDTKYSVKYISKFIDTQPIISSINSSCNYNLNDNFITPTIFRTNLLKFSKTAKKNNILLPEGEDIRVIKAAIICSEKKIANCTLLGSQDIIFNIAKNYNLSLHKNIKIIDPDLILERYIFAIKKIKCKQKLEDTQAIKELKNRNILGLIMLSEGDIDGVVCGAVYTTADVVRSALQLIRANPKFNFISSVFFMLTNDKVLIYGDCAINLNPDSYNLAKIAIQSANTASLFGIKARIAMISYVTGYNNTTDQYAKKVYEATEYVRNIRPDIIIDGPIQYDAACSQDIAIKKSPNSPLFGKANIYIFPDINTGNSVYKAVQHTSNILSIGPIIQGLNKPVNDLSRGACIDDIVYTIALTVIQANNENNK